MVAIFNNKLFLTTLIVLSLVGSLFFSISIIKTSEQTESELFAGGGTLNSAAYPDLKYQARYQGGIQYRHKPVLIANFSMYFTISPNLFQFSSHAENQDLNFTSVNFFIDAMVGVIDVTTLDLDPTFETQVTLTIDENNYTDSNIHTVLLYWLPDQPKLDYFDYSVIEEYYIIYTVRYGFTLANNTKDYTTISDNDYFIYDYSNGWETDESGGPFSLHEKDRFQIIHYNNNFRFSGLMISIILTIIILYQMRRTYLDRKLQS